MEAPIAGRRPITSGQGQRPVLLHAHSKARLFRRSGKPAKAQPLCIGTTVQNFSVAGTNGRCLTQVAAAQGVVFFMNTESDVCRLPLEPQQLLGLRSGELHKDSDINQAFDVLTNANLEPGYSPQIAEGRAEVLSTVRSNLISSKRVPMDRRDRDTEIPTDLLPSCLALLVELGESELVIQLGTDMLSSGEVDSYPVTQADILLSMALAKCNMAREEFEGSTQVAGGCQHLEEALQLLLPKGLPPVAPALIREVQASLAQLACQRALEQMSGPADKEHADERRHAVRGIREMLKQADAESTAGKAASSGTVAPVNREFMARLVPLLTCDELVHLQEWELVARHANMHKWLYPGLVERVANGHILLGYQQCQPAYIQMAVQLLKQLVPSSETLVAQAVCQVLLGKVHSALDLLAHAEGAPPRAFASDMPSSPLWGAQAHAYVQKNTPVGEDGMLPGLCKYTQQWLGKVPLPLFRDDSSPEATSVGPLTTYFENTRVEALITVYDEKNGNISESVQGALDNIRQGVGRIQEVARTKLTAAADLPAPPALSDLPPLSDPTARKLLAPVTAAAGILALALIVWPRTSKDVQARAAQGAPATSDVSPSARQAAVGQAVQDASAHLTPKVAEQVLKLWQDVKAQALGVDHDASRLQDVLVEPFLGMTRRQVQKFKSDGLYMRYKLNRIKVKDIDSSQSSGVVLVTATLEESASLYDDGSQVDSYTALVYDAQYEFIKSKDGAWRVANVTVLGQKGGI